MREWEKDELDEQIGQATMLLSKLLKYSDDCSIRTVCEKWIEEHKSYLPDEPKGYSISELDGDERKLNF